MGWLKMTEAIIVAIISGIASFLAVYISNRKAAAVAEYRLEQLERKVDRHNQVIERTFRLEEGQAVLEEKVRVANHRIDDLERKVS